jgi:amidase
VPAAPKIEPWHGMSIWGPIARRVADGGRFYDAIRDGGAPLAQAAASEPGRLRVAVSRKVPRGVPARPDAEQLGAVEGTAALLRDLGHEVVDRELDYGTAWPNMVARYLRGIHDEGELLPNRERLSRRTRGYMRLGGTVPLAAVRRARAQQAADAARIDRVFDEGADLVLTPMFTRRPGRVLEYEGRSAFWTVNGTGRFVPYPGPFNHTGHPAAAVPAGFTGDGFPLSVQLVAPPDRDTVLISLAAQLERARDWPAHRPAAAP